MLIGLVIAAIIITGAYVGYHASQASPPEVGSHGVYPELSSLAYDISDLVSIKADQQLLL